jgi:quinol monooxygenase YgiN
MPYVRMFHSAIDPAEVDLVRKTFGEDLRPTFAAVEGCRSLELLIATEPNAGGLIEGCVLARWDSVEAIERAYQEPEVRASAARIVGLLRQEPVINLYEVIG